MCKESGEWFHIILLLKLFCLGSCQEACACQISVRMDTINCQFLINKPHALRNGVLDNYFDGYQCVVYNRRLPLHPSPYVMVFTIEAIRVTRPTYWYFAVCSQCLQCFFVIKTCRNVREMRQLYFFSFENSLEGVFHRILGAFQIPYILPPYVYALLCARLPPRNTPRSRSRPSKLHILS